MAVIVIPGVVQVSIVGNQADGPWANVTHWAEALPGSSPEDVAQAVLDSFVDDLLPRLTSTVTVAGANYVDLSSSSGATGSVTYSGSNSTTGTVTVAPCPPQVAYLIKLSSSGGRGSRSGRMFLPGVRSDEVGGDGIVASGTRTTLTTAARDFASDVASASQYALVIAHKSGSLSGTSSAVTDETCEASVATIRRRLRR